VEGALLAIVKPEIVDLDEVGLAGNEVVGEFGRSVGRQGGLGGHGCQDFFVRKTIWVRTLVTVTRVTSTSEAAQAILT